MLAGAGGEMQWLTSQGNVLSMAVTCVVLGVVVAIQRLFRDTLLSYSLQLLVLGLVPAVRIAIADSSQGCVAATHGYYKQKLGNR